MGIKENENERSKKPKYTQFGDWLRKIRKENEKYNDIDVLSEVTGIETKMLYMYEQGRHLPPLNKFIKICNALGKTPSFMLQPLLDIPKPEDKDLIDFFDVFQSTYHKTPFKDIAKILVLSLNCIQLGHEMYGSENPVEGLMKFKEAVLTRLK